MEITIPVDEILKQCYTRAEIDFKLNALKVDILSTISKAIMDSARSNDKPAQRVVTVKPEVSVTPIAQPVTEASVEQPVTPTIVQTPVETPPAQYEFLDFDSSRFS